MAGSTKIGSVVVGVMTRAGTRGEGSLTTTGGSDNMSVGDDCIFIVKQHKTIEGESKHTKKKKRKKKNMRDTEHSRT